MKAAQPWRLLGAADIDAIARGLQPLAQAWADEWLPDTALAFSVVDAHARPLLRAADGEQVLSLKNEQGGIGAVLMYGSALIGMLQQQALSRLGVPPVQALPGGSLTAALAHYQLRDLLARLARLPAGSARKQTLYSQDPALSPTDLKGNGAVLVLLAWDRHAVRIRLPHDAIANWCRPPTCGKAAPLVARTEALAGRSLPFRLQAGAATLALADLLALQPGHVIPLDTGPDQPMALVCGDGPGFGRCYLSLQDGRPVIQFCS